MTVSDINLQGVCFYLSWQLSRPSVTEQRQCPSSSDIMLTAITWSPSSLLRNNIPMPHTCTASSQTTISSPLNYFLRADQTVVCCPNVWRKLSRKFTSHLHLFVRRRRGGERGVTNTMQPHSHPLHWLEGQYMYTATCKQENRGEQWELGAVGAEGAVHHLNS